jgi:hypothetical protein
MKFYTLILGLGLTFSIGASAAPIFFETSIPLSEPRTRCEQLARTSNGLFFVRYQLMEDKNPKLPGDCPITNDFRFSVYSRTEKGWTKSDYKMDLTNLKANFPKLLINQARISEDGMKLMVMMDREYLDTPWIAVGKITPQMGTPFRVLDRSVLKGKHIQSWSQDFSVALLGEDCFGGTCLRFYQTYSFDKNAILSEAKSSQSSGRAYAMGLNKKFYAVVREAPNTVTLSSLEFHSYDEQIKPFILSSPVPTLGQYWISEAGVLSYFPNPGASLVQVDLRSGQSTTKNLQSIVGKQLIEFMDNGILRAFKYPNYEIINIDDDLVEQSYAADYNATSNEVSLDKKLVVFSGSNQAKLVELETKDTVLPNGTNTWSLGSWNIDGSQRTSVHFLNEYGDVLWGLKDGKSSSSFTPTIFVRQ